MTTPADRELRDATAELSTAVRGMRSAGPTPAGPPVLSPLYLKLSEASTEPHVRDYFRLRAEGIPEAEAREKVYGPDAPTGAGTGARSSSGPSVVPTPAPAPPSLTSAIDAPPPPPPTVPGLDLGASAPLPAPASSPGPTGGTFSPPGPGFSPSGTADPPRLLTEIRDLLKRGITGESTPTTTGFGPTSPTGDMGRTGGLLTPLLNWFQGTAAGRVGGQLWSAARTAGSAVADTRLGRGLGRVGRGVGRALTRNPLSRSVGSAARGLAGTKAGRATASALGGARDYLFGSRPGGGEKPVDVRVVDGKGGGPGPGGGGPVPTGGGEGAGPAAVAGSLGKLGGAVGMLTTGLFAAGKAGLDLASSQEQAMRKLAQVSPSQAMIFAELDMNRLQRNQEKGEDTADSSQGLADSLDKFEKALQPLETAFDNLMNSVGSGVLDVLADGVGLLTDVLKNVIDAINWAGRNLVDAINTVNPGKDLKWDDFKLGGNQPGNRENWMLKDQVEEMRKAAAAEANFAEQMLHRVREEHNRRFRK